MIAFPFLCLWALLPLHDPAPQPQDNQPLLVAVRDAQTGELRQPTPEEFQALTQHFQKRSLPQMEEVQRADGTVTMRLNGHFMSYSVLIKREDGTSFEACIKNPDELPQLKKHFQEAPLEY